MVDIPSILIVEDERDVSATIQSFLGKKGFLVLTTPSGFEALSIIKAFQPDLILLDITLIDLNGIEVLKSLRVYDKKTKVILMTGQSFSQQEIDIIKDLGISGYQSKPLVLNEIEKLIYKVLESKKDLNGNSLVTLTDKEKGMLCKNDSIHQLANLLNIIRIQCEQFTLNIEDGVYKDKSSDDLVKISFEIMKNVQASVDRAIEVVETIDRI